MNKKSSISIFALVMLMTGAVDGVGNLPAIAIFGQQLVFFFIVGSLLFLLPTGLVSAELCSQYKQDSGVYVWSREAFGKKFGTLVVWLQWINTMVWFPTCLTTLVGTISYLIDPKLIHHPAYLVLTSLGLFWVMTCLNFKGVKQSTKIASWATGLGMVVPMLLVMGLSLLWIILGKPLAINLDKHAILPHLSSTGIWSSLTAIIAAFLGLELATVHVRKVKNAGKIFPKALIYTILVIIFTMGLGSLGVALVIPHQDIDLVAGTVQAFKLIFVGFDMPWLGYVLGGMLLFGSLGTMVNWLVSPANGLCQAAKDGHLPKILAKENENGVPKNVLIFQGIVVSIISMSFFLMPSVNGSYWLLLDLSTELYLLMYLLMFV
jgi:amino acid transporter